MSTTTISPPIASACWIMSMRDPDDDPDLEDATGTTIAEITDAGDPGEVAVHFTLPEQSNALVSVYMTRVGALALAGQLQQEAMRAKIG